jgi:tetratricopeptide (TPR) repeat protein
VALGLVLLTAIALGRVLAGEFLTWDDDLYVTNNPHVRRGLTLDGILWAIAARDVSNWHPVTWLSHMADVQLFGMNPAGHHATSLVFHIANACLLFAVLRRMTGGLWRSAFVAALFAVHPLHVESVAWVSERKDVLSTLFWMATLWGYAEYVRRPGPLRYLLVLVPFALGLAAKPMLVTLPFVLLLLDVWPLRRGREGGPGSADEGLPALGRAAPRLLLEKVPLFALAAASSVVTYIVQKQAGAVAEAGWVPAWVRLTNPLVSYVGYIAKLFWPVDLAAFYPHPKSIAVWQAAGSLAILVALTTWVLRRLNRQPYLAVGWLWYAGTMVPVIGWIQVGEQAMADRYTYVPCIGLFVALAWGVADQPGRRPRVREAMALAGVLAILACAILAWRQAGYWRNGVALWTRTLQVTRENSLAHFQLGVALARAGQPAAALAEYDRSLRIDPESPQAHSNVGAALLALGRPADAIGPLQRAIRLRPEHPQALNNLGAALVDLGRPAEATGPLERALRVAPRYAAARHNLGRALARMGRVDEAVEQLRRTLRDAPHHAPAHVELGLALARQGRIDEAIAEYEAALRVQPDHPEAHNNLGAALERSGRLEEALRHYDAAALLAPSDPVARYNLGAALAAAGRDAAAVPHYVEALRLRPDYPDAHNNLGAALANEGRIAEAIPHFEEALRLRPGYADARRNLDSARVLLQVR